MPETQQANFEGWAVVELMGHQREIGYVTTEAYGTAVLFRVDTPGLEDREFTLTRPERDDSYTLLPEGSVVRRKGVPARTRLISPAALYAINPCTEEAARTAIERTINRPFILVQAPAGVQLTAPEPVESFPDEDPDDAAYIDND